MRQKAEPLTLVLSSLDNIKFYTGIKKKHEELKELRNVWVTRLDFQAQICHLFWVILLLIKFPHLD